MFASLTSLLGGGYVFPYELGERYDIAWGRWEHLRATRTEDSKEVSCFRLTAKPSETLMLEAARNGVKRLRMVRSCSCWPTHCKRQHPPLTPRPCRADQASPSACV